MSDACVDRKRRDFGLSPTDWARLRTLEHLHHLDSAEALQMNFALQDARYRITRDFIKNSDDLQIGPDVAAVRKYEVKAKACMAGISNLQT